MNTMPSRRDNVKMCAIIPLLNNNCPSSLTTTASLSPDKLNFDLEISYFTCLAYI